MNTSPSTRIDVDTDLRGRKTLDGLSADTRGAVERAGIVLVPDDGFRGYAGPVFPLGTVDFLHFLRAHAPSGTDVVIAAEDTGYKEVVLHSDIVRLATLFVEYVAAPIAMSLIAAYLRDFLGSRFKRAEARAAIIVHRKEGAVEQTLRISYEGPAQNAEEALKAAIASLPTKPGETPPPRATATTPAAQRTTPKQVGTKKKNPRRK
jgi:hypothetical protein